MWGMAVMYVFLIPGVALFLHAKHEYGSSAPATVGLKAACTSVIVLEAVEGVSRVPDPLRGYSVLITAGLILGLVGDVVICQPEAGGFLSGMIYFALGHLCYIAAFIRISAHVMWGVPIFLVIYLILALAVLKLHIPLGSMMHAVAIYAAIITAMVSLSVTVVFSAKNGLLLPIGAILFAVSDGILAFGKFAKKDGSQLASFGLYCYFIGQSLFAVSIYYLSI